MEEASNSVQDIPDDKPKVQDPVKNENDEKHQKEEIQNPDENAEANKRNADDEGSNVKSEEMDNGGDVKNPPKDENDEKHQKEVIQNLDKNVEANKGNAKDEGSNVKSEEKKKHFSKSFKMDDEKHVNEIIDNSIIKLSDGTEAPVYSRGPLYFDGTWPINCHVCSIHGIPNSRRLSRHNKSDEHRNLLNNNPVDAKKYRAGLNQVYSISRPKYNNLIKIYPGEKITEITPELYDRILPVQELIAHPRPSESVYRNIFSTEPFHKKKKKAIIGLSYCFKMPYTKSFGYFCALCQDNPAGSAFDPQHFVGPKHRDKYAQKHFPRLTSKISGFLSDMKDEKAKQKVIGQVIQKVYRHIEVKRGFREIHIVGARIYPQRCAKFCNTIVHYEDNHVLKNDEELKEMTEKCRRGKNPQEPQSLKNESEHSKTHSKGDAESSKDLRSKKEESTVRQKVPHLEDNARNWDRYRRMLGAALDDIDDRYAVYKKIPEKHPAYEDEWKKFWKRRVKEVEKDGLNPDDYDFKTEWIPHWKEKMQKYYSSSVSRTKFNIKKTLRLPFDKRSPSPLRKQRALRRKRSPSPGRPSRRRRTRSRSPAYRARPRESPPAIAKSLEPPGVISVLRLLTALEDMLGSLGPKALEYLSKSLLYEKDEGNNANQLLSNQEYYVFFVTAKEKLKGQLIAGLVEKTKNKAVTRVIEEMETLIKMFDNFCKRTGRTITAQPQNDRPLTSKQQEPSFNDNNQYPNKSQDDYNINRQQDFDKSRCDNNRYNPYQRGGGQMNQYRGSGGNNNQYSGPQNQYDTASSNQCNDDASNSNQYGQNRSISSYQGSSSDQYSRSNQGGVWQSGTNMTFRTNANNPQGSGGGNYGNNGNQGDQGRQNFRSDREGNLNTSFGDRGGNYNSNPDSSRSGNYNLNLGNCGGNYNNSPLPLLGTLQGNTGYNQGNFKRDSYNDSQNRNDNNQQNQGYGSGNNYNAAYTSGNGGSFNSGFGGNNQGRNMAPPDVVMNKPLGNYGGYNDSNMNTRGYGGGNQYN